MQTSFVSIAMSFLYKKRHVLDHFYNTKTQNQLYRHIILSSNTFLHEDLVKGGKLVMKMGSKPNKKWGSKPEDAPPSMSKPLH